MYCTLPEVTHLFLLGNSGSSFIPKCFDCDHMISCDHVIVYIMCLFLKHVLYELGSVTCYVHLELYMCCKLF